MAKEALLAKTLVEMADNLVTDFDVVDLLSLLADRCVEVLEVGAAGLMLSGPDGRLHVVASSSETMRLLELFEIQSAEGPCLDCYKSGEPVLYQDLSPDDDRWPRFAPEAIAAGFNSVDALPMRLRGSVIGALNLFHFQKGGIPQDDLHSAQTLADVATITILQHQASLEALAVNSQLNNALNSRVTIEQAKGMLAERLNLDMAEAFAILRSYARDHNLRLSRVAHDLVEGTLAISALASP